PWLLGSMKLGRTWLKVERAIHHLIELRGEIARIESGPYELVEVRDGATGDRTWVLRADDAAQHLLGWSMYGVIVGDFVHNLRSALDHAVWGPGSAIARWSCCGRSCCLCESTTAHSMRAAPLRARILYVRSWCARSPFGNGRWGARSGTH